MANIREELRYKAEIVGKLKFRRKPGLYGSSWNKVLKMAFWFMVFWSLRGLLYSVSPEM
jgi:hypothetical protein